MRIGITGGIGSGKSTVCNIFAVLGIKCYDADARAKLLMESNQELREEIIELFGPESFSGGHLQRQYIAQIVFDDPNQLQKLNAMVHPRVSIDFDLWAKSQTDQPYVLKEAALLVETGSYKQLDKLIVVRAPEALRVSRIRVRDPQRSEDQIKAIIRKQLPDDEKLKVADFVVTNDEKEPLIQQILKIHSALME